MCSLPRLHGARDHDHRRHYATRRLSAPDAGGFQDVSRAAMRVLHARHGHERPRPRSAPAACDRGRDPRTGLEGNLCRCTGYQNIVKAVLPWPPGPWRPEEAAMNAVRGSLIGQLRRAQGGLSLPRRALGSTRTTSSLPGQSYGYFLRSPHAHARIRAIDAAAARAAPGVLAVFTGADLAGIGGLPCGWLIKSIDGSPMKEPQAPGPRGRQGAPCRRAGRARGCRDSTAEAKAAAALIEVDYEVLPAVVDTRIGRGGTAPPSTTRRPTMSATRGRSATKRRGRRGFRQRGACHQAQLRQQSPDSERDRAARRQRRALTGGRLLHAVRDEPEPARRAPADDCVRARHFPSTRCG